MDYSSTIHDTDDPAGASPWGNSPVSSPSRNTSTFQPISGDPPPFRYSAQSSNGLAQDHSEGDSFPRPGTATTASGTEDGTEASGTLNPSESESTAGVEEGAPAHSQQQGHAAAQAQETQTQPQKPAQPQYRLQAKITGLERTGKKDPILRFDVHVGRPLPSFLVAD